MSAGVILGGAVVGNFVDVSPRLATMKRSLVVQNISVSVCCGVVIALLVRGHKNGHQRDAGFWILVSCLLGASVVSTLASLAGTLSVEKDWVVVICKDSPGVSDPCAAAVVGTSANRVPFRPSGGRAAPRHHQRASAPHRPQLQDPRPDCSFVEGTGVFWFAWRPPPPGLSIQLVGLVMSYASMLGGAIFITAWNLVSWVPEFYFLRKIYDSYPVLHHKPARPASEGGNTSFLALACSQTLVFIRGWKVPFLASPT